MNLLLVMLIVWVEAPEPSIQATPSFAPLLFWNVLSTMSMDWTVLDTPEMYITPPFKPAELLMKELFVMERIKSELGWNSMAPATPADLPFAIVQPVMDMVMGDLVTVRICVVSPPSNLIFTRESDYPI